MLSRRSFFTITIIMFILFVMFQFTGVMREQWNDYDNNTYALRGEKIDSRETVSFGREETEEEKSARTIVYVGGKERTDTEQMVRLWCAYTDRHFVRHETLEEAALEGSYLPEFIVMDSGALDFSRDTALLSALTDMGQDMIFCNLPPVKTIRENDVLRDILGIQAVWEDEIQLEGVELFDGFLLGGAAIYQEDEEDMREEDYESPQDLDLTIPWYAARASTKTYMVGLVDREPYGGEDALKNENLPAIIWRNSVENARIFAVNGTYMEDIAAIGFLQAMAYEANDYAVYPVVNAQNLVVNDFAAFSSEKDDMTMSLYSRTQKAFFQEIIWPSLAAVIESSSKRPTVMLSPLLDYSSGETSDQDKLIFYLKSFHESEGEAGLTVGQDPDISVEEKLEKDQEFLGRAAPEYHFSALYMDADTDLHRRMLFRDTSGLREIHTTCVESDPQATPLSYIGENTIRQVATVDGFRHTYSDDLRVKSLETALGYSTILIDLDRLLNPESEDDQWQNLAEDFSRFTNTYWKPFRVFDQTVLSESAYRTQLFLSVDYSHTRTDDRIILEADNYKEPCWFLLRTHGEKIVEAQGADYTQVEEDAYLVTLRGRKATFRVAGSIDPVFYAE